MKPYTAIVDVCGVQEERIFKVPDLLEAEMFVYNTIGIQNSHTGRSDKFIRIKRTRKIIKKQRK